MLPRRLWHPIAALAATLLISPPAAAPTDRPQTTGRVAWHAGTDPLLGPWPVEHLLMPYPADALEGIRPVASTPPDRGAFYRMLRQLRAAGGTLEELIDAAVQTVRSCATYFEAGVGPPSPPPPSTQKEQSAIETPHHQVRSLPPGNFDDIFQGPLSAPLPTVGLAVVEVPVSAVPALPWLAAPDFAAEGFVSTSTPTPTTLPGPAPGFAPLEPRRGVAGVIPVYVKMAATVFLAAIVMVPVGCSFVAGALYVHPRDGPADADRRNATQDPRAQRPLPSCFWSSRHTIRPTASIPITETIQ